MNAHIEDMDGYTDTTGNVLLDLCEEHHLVFVNTEDKCPGRITGEARHCQSPIDYCLVSHKLCTRLERMQTDEDGKHRKVTINVLG